MVELPTLLRATTSGAREDDKKQIMETEIETLKQRLEEMNRNMSELTRMVQQGSNKPTTVPPNASPTNKPTTSSPSPSPTNKPTNPPTSNEPTPPPSLPPTNKPTSLPSPPRTNMSTLQPTNAISSSDQGNLIALNPTATLARDVVSIRHITKQSKLVVTLRANATCPRPYLVGRLSGPTLVKVDGWKWSLAPDKSTTLMGTYQVPLGGNYTVEIIAVYCDNFFHDYLEQSKSNGYRDGNSADMRKMRSFDFKKVCVEDPFHHRLTEDNASIHIPPAAKSPFQNKLIGNSNSWTGNWYNKAVPDLIPATMNTSVPMVPVHTRFQAERCFSAQQDRREEPPECSVAANKAALQAYQFRWHPNLLETTTIRQTEPHYICVVGWSHSHWMVKDKGYSKKLSLQMDTVNVEFEWIKAHFPEEVQCAPKCKVKQDRLFSVLDSTKPCSSLVIGVGQWPASSKRGSLLNDYYDDIARMTQRLEDAGVTRKMQVFLRSIHYNPLNGVTSACPPKDWRNPLVIDAYNAVIQQVAHSANVTYLDTKFLADPMWDAANDWCHLDLATGTQEVLYIAASVLGVKPVGTLGSGNVE